MFHERDFAKELKDMYSLPKNKPLLDEAKK
jgi:hypothetical protein